MALNKVDEAWNKRYPAQNWSPSSFGPMLKNEFVAGWNAAMDKNKSIDKCRTCADVGCDYRSEKCGVTNNYQMWRPRNGVK